jgi:hypothetical protein
MQGDDAMQTGGIQVELSLIPATAGVRDSHRPGNYKNTWHFLTYSNDAGRDSQLKTNILKNATPWVAIMTSPLINTTKDTNGAVCVFSCCLSR